MEDSFDAQFVPSAETTDSVEGAWPPRQSHVVTRGHGGLATKPAAQPVRSSARTAVTAQCRCDDTLRQALWLDPS